jgi:CheY-like chemotaxis protein
MTNQIFIQDYYGKTNVFRKNIENKETIFIIDDNKVYLSLLKKTLKKRGYKVLGFTSGEEAIKYLEAKPAIIIMDYHLDGANPYAKKGDEISFEIKTKLPETEIILMSSDKKFEFISRVNFSKHILYKDSHIITKIQSNIALLLSKIYRRRIENSRIEKSN